MLALGSETSHWPKGSQQLFRITPIQSDPSLDSSRTGTRENDSKHYLNPY